MLDRVYFDNASTTNIHPEVLKSYISLLQKYYVNSESIYSEGIENGEKLGIAKGEKLGIEKGELKKAKETALSLAEMGLSVDKIAQAVKINVDTVREWIDGNV